MSQTINTGNINISGSVVPTGIATAGTGQTVITQNTATNGAAQDAYTVTAGKTFYLYAIHFTCSTTGNCYVYKNDGTTIVSLSYTTAAGSNNDLITGGGCPLAVYTSGQKVKINGTTGYHLTIYGVEV